MLQFCYHRFGFLFVMIKMLMLKSYTIRIMTRIGKKITDQKCRRNEIEFKTTEEFEGGELVIRKQTEF